MPRVRQIGRTDTDDPVVHGMYDLVFGPGIDPVEGHPTDTGSVGDWWTTFALVPDVLEHAVSGFVLYRSPLRHLDPVLRELSLTRAGWLCGSTFVYSQHCKSLRGLDVDPDKIAAIESWSVSDRFDATERAVLAFTDSIVRDHGRVPDALFAELQRNLSDEAILELAYVSAMYGMHAAIVRSLRLEWDNGPDPVREIDPPAEFDAAHFVNIGATEDTKAAFGELASRRRAE